MLVGRGEDGSVPDELGDGGDIVEADDVHLPGIFVQKVVVLTPEQAADKRIERRTVRPPQAPATPAAAGDELRTSGVV